MKINKQMVQFDFRSMLFTSDTVDVIGKEILCNKSYADMWSDSEIKSRESNPKLGDTLIDNSFTHSIENIFIRELSVGILFHLLNFSFCIIKW